MLCKPMRIAIIIICAVVCCADQIHRSRRYTPKGEKPLFYNPIVVLLYFLFCVTVGIVIFSFVR